MSARRRTPPTAPACVFSPRPASRPRACPKPSSGWPTRSSMRRATSTPTCSRIRCPRNACGRWKGSPRPARIGTSRIRPRCRHGTISRAPSSTASSIRATASRAAIRSATTASPARYARAIASIASATLPAAMQQIDALIQAQPQNPYFHELKGQALAGGRTAGGRHRAAAPRRAACAQSGAHPDHARAGLARVEQQGHRRGGGHFARNRNRGASRNRRKRSTRSRLPTAARATSRRADLASAQASFTRGDLKTARALAGRAKSRFPVGSPGWVKADDIASYKPKAIAAQIIPKRTT